MSTKFRSQMKEVMSMMNISRVEPSREKICSLISS